uniref:SCP domain-containing protein n=1 Tax=Romanomermis culicivorax TaxID=13658 RepID=A0A915J1J7_ROMCU
KWDDKLAEVSQRWIEFCYEKGHSEDRFRESISGYKPVGENMAYSWSTEMEKTMQNSTEVARIVVEFIKCRTYCEALYLIEDSVCCGYNFHTNDTYFMITKPALFKTSLKSDLNQT